jgi:hypothetical protein
MFTTKIRTAIIALVAVFTFAGASAVPAISQAERNSDQFTHEEICGARYEKFGEAIHEQRRSEAEFGEGNTEAKEWREKAQEALDEAWVEECDWAASVRPPTPGLPRPGLIPAPSGTLQGASPGAGTVAPVRVIGSYAAIP